MQTDLSACLSSKHCTHSTAGGGTNQESLVGGLSNSHLHELQLGNIAANRLTHSSVLPKTHWALTMPRQADSTMAFTGHTAHFSIL